MKRVIVIGICLCLFCCLTEAEVNHYIGVDAELAEQSMLSHLSDGKSFSGLGIGGAAGGVYEMHAGKFVLQTGIQANIAWTSFSVPDNTKTITGVVDDEGDKLDYIFNQKNRHDSYTDLSFQIPVMIGAQVRNFYFLAGVKVDLSVFGSSKVKAEFSTAGDYEKFIDPFEEMPEHLYYSNLQYNKKQSISFKPDIRPSFEIGYVFGSFNKETGFDVPKQKDLYKLALFVDYGILSRIDKGTNESFIIPQSFNSSDMSEGIEANNILSTTEIDGKANCLSVGVKFTVLFRLPNKRKCVICDL